MSQKLFQTVGTLPGAGGPVHPARCCANSHLGESRRPQNPSHLFGKLVIESWHHTKKQYELLHAGVKPALGKMRERNDSMWIKHWNDFFFFGRQPHMVLGCSGMPLTEVPFLESKPSHRKAGSARFVHREGRVHVHHVLRQHLLHVEASVVPLQCKTQHKVIYIIRCCSFKRTVMTIRMLWDTARTWPQCSWCWNLVGQVVQAPWNSSCPFPADWLAQWWSAGPSISPAPCIGLCWSSRTECVKCISNEKYCDKLEFWVLHVWCSGCWWSEELFHRSTRIYDTLCFLQLLGCWYGWHLFLFSLDWHWRLTSVLFLFCFLPFPLLLFLLFLLHIPCLSFSVKLSDSCLSLQLHKESTWHELTVMTDPCLQDVLFSIGLPGIDLQCCCSWSSCFLHCQLRRLVFQGLAVLPQNMIWTYDSRLNSFRDFMICQNSEPSGISTSTPWHFHVEPILSHMFFERNTDDVEKKTVGSPGKSIFQSTCESLGKHTFSPGQPSCRPHPARELSQAFNFV